MKGQAVMTKIDIKPLSVNKAYRGRRFATTDLTDYKKTLEILLPAMEIKDTQLEVSYIFGTSSRGSDGDNFIKAFQDCISEQYGFNDNKIYKWTVVKKIVPKGEEYVEFDIKEYIE